MKNTNIQQKYLSRAKIVAIFLQLTPFTRMVALTGSLARGEAKDSSDIDFFIVTKKNRIWTCRLLVTALVYLTGFRRYDNKIAGRICLNCYQTDNHLLISPQNKKNAEDYAHLLPFWERGRVFENFKKENLWIKKYGSNFTKKSTIFRHFLPLIIFQVIWEIIFEIFFNNFVENLLKKYQMQRILKDPRTKNSPKGSIFISDTELRFHPLKLRKIS